MTSGLRKSKKCIIFSIDAVIASAIAFILLAVVYNSAIPADSFSYAAMSRLGGDIAAVLDYQNVFGTLDQGIIESRMDELLPQNYDMRIEVECESGSASAGSAVLGGRDRGAGKIYFVKDAGDYCTARYWIWLK